MTQGRSHNPTPDFDAAGADRSGGVRPLGEAAQIRALADGELGPAEAGQVLEQAGADGPGRVAFEQSLRGAVARIMSEGASAPADLRERILAQAHEDAYTDSEIDHHDTAPLQMRVSRRPPWSLLIAATVALTAGAAVLMRGGLMWTSSTPQQGQTAQVAQVTRLASFVSAQHDKCALFSEHFKRKMVARTEAEATAAAVELLDRVPHVLDLRATRLAQAGYEFAGLGRCGVPGKGRSAHLMYRSQTADAPTVSLFVQEDLGSLPLEDGRFYCCRQAESKGTSLTLWREDGLVYYLFTPRLDDAEHARAAFGAPTERGTL